MPPTDQTNKLTKLIAISYLLAVIIIMMSLYIIVSNLLTANSIDSKLVQTHTTQLNISDFNKILNQIKK
jgi:hypothetical protein